MKGRQQRQGIELLISVPNRGGCCPRFYRRRVFHSGTSRVVLSEDLPSNCGASAAVNQSASPASSVDRKNKTKCPSCPEARPYVRSFEKPWLRLLLLATPGSDGAPCLAACVVLLLISRSGDRRREGAADQVLDGGCPHPISRHKDRHIRRGRFRRKDENRLPSPIFLSLPHSLFFGRGADSGRRKEKERKRNEVTADIRCETRWKTRSGKKRASERVSVEGNKMMRAQVEKTKLGAEVLSLLSLPQRVDRPPSVCHCCNRPRSFGCSAAGLPMGPMPSAALRPRTKNLITGTKVRAPYIYEGARTHAHGMTKGPLGVADSFVLLLLVVVCFSSVCQARMLRREP